MQRFILEAPGKALDLLAAFPGEAYVRGPGEAVLGSQGGGAVAHKKYSGGHGPGSVAVDTRQYIGLGPGWSVAACEVWPLVKMVEFSNPISLVATVEQVLDFSRLWFDRPKCPFKGFFLL